MRSWSILFPDLEGLEGFLCSKGRPSIPETLDPWLEPPFVDAASGRLKGLFKERLLPEKLERAYFGVEFCQRLIPDGDSLRKAISLVREARLSFSFVTPPVTDSGIEELRSRFTLLERESGCSNGIEVVVNDWGTLRLLRKEFPGLQPVFGRMMNKMIRDPRVTPYYATSKAPPDGLLAVQQSSLSNPAFQRALLEWGVGRHEFDNLIQGLRLEPDGASALSVYIPYGYVATGRVCMPGSFGLPKALKFTEYMGCQKECQSYTLRLRNTESPFTNRDLELIQRGNTIFYPHTLAMLEAVLEGESSSAVDRIVYQPNLPM